MFSTAYRDEPQQAWGAATSPSPAAAVGRHRTPRDDAPTYDPLLWKGTDNAYITSLAAYTMTHQPPTASAPAKPPLQKFLASSWNSTPEEEAAARLSKFHAVYDRRPSTVLGRLLQFLSSRFFPRWHEGVQPADVMALPTSDLIQLMQLALAAGEADRSAMLARELSRRKLALQMEAVPSSSAAASQGGDSRRGSVFRDASPPLHHHHHQQQSPASPLPRPVGLSGYSAVLPPSRQQQQQQAPTPSPQANPWVPQAADEAGRASWSATPPMTRNAYTTGDYARASRPVSVERTALWDEEAVPRPPSQASTEQGAPSFGSDLNLSSVHASETHSPWLSSPRWSTPWATSGPQTPF